MHYSEAWDELADFSAKFGIPVCESCGGKGAMKKDSPLSLGGAGALGNQAAGDAARQADLVLIVGSRLNDLATGSHSVFQNEEVDVCPHQRDRL